MLDLNQLIYRNVIEHGNVRRKSMSDTEWRCSDVPLHNKDSSQNVNGLLRFLMKVFQVFMGFICTVTLLILFTNILLGLTLKK